MGLEGGGSDFGEESVGESVLVGKWLARVLELDFHGTVFQWIF